jgi:hypothetical protein
MYRDGSDAFCVFSLFLLPTERGSCICAVHIGPVWYVHIPLEKCNCSAIGSIIVVLCRAASRQPAPVHGKPTRLLLHMI